MSAFSSLLCPVGDAVASKRSSAPSSNAHSREERHHVAQEIAEDDGQGQDCRTDSVADSSSTRFVVRTAAAGE